MYHMIDPLAIELPDSSAPQEQSMNYKPMKLFQDDIKDNISKTSAPASVTSVVLKVNFWCIFVFSFESLILCVQMCEMSVFLRPTADQVLKEMKQPHP